MSYIIVSGVVIPVKESIETYELLRSFHEEAAN